MKVSNKLYSLFIILLFIILLLGYAGFMVQGTLNKNFQKYAGQILPNAIEAIKMRAEMERISEYSKLYELTGKGENRWKAWNAINGLDQNLQLYVSSAKGHVSDSTLKNLSSNIKLFIEYSVNFLKTDKSLKPSQYEEMKNLMNIQQLKISYTIKALIDNDVQKTKQTESVLGKTTNQSFLLIVVAISFSILVFIIALIITYISILKPIKSLTKTAELIGKGDVESEIESSILIKKDEIGILARSINSMVSHLVEIFESRNELNTEVNEEIEKKSKVIEYSHNLMQLKNKGEKIGQENPTLFNTYFDSLVEPINGILGFIELLNQSTLSQEKKNYFTNQIKNNALTLSQLIDDLHDLSKIETGKFKISKSAFSALDFLSEIVSLAENERNKAYKKEIRILTKPDSRILQFNTDKYRIKQILNKLIDNAIKNTFKGQIEIGYEIMEHEKQILFFVKDTGVGIPNFVRQSVFNKTKTLPNIENKQIGYSLAVCKSILGEMNGEIWLESTEGKGTSVYFTIPHESIIENMEPLTSSNVDWSDKTFLIVDDEEINKVLIEECLEKTNAKLIYAKNGKEAVYLFSTIPNIDLILMDIKMPEIDGYKATEIIKTQNKNIPIIANTAYALLYERETCLQSGFDDYIAKPFSISDLINKINKHLK